MPLHVRSIAINIAVTCFFALSLIGWFRGHSPAVCCERATIGAVLAYVVSALAVRGINAVLIRAVIAEHVDQQMNSGSASNGGAAFKDKVSRAGS